MESSTLAALITIGTALVASVITGIAEIRKDKSNARMIQKDVTETRAEAEKAHTSIKGDTQAIREAVSTRSLSFDKIFDWVENINEEVTEQKFLRENSGTSKKEISEALSLFQHLAVRNEELSDAILEANDKVLNVTTEKERLQRERDDLLKQKSALESKVADLSKQLQKANNQIERLLTPTPPTDVQDCPPPRR